MYNGNSPVQITQRFDENGNELIGDRTYEVTIDTDAPSANWFQKLIGGDNEASIEEAHASLLNVALTGNNSGEGPVAAGDQVTLQFTELQMQELMTDMRSTVDAYEEGHAPRDLQLYLGGYDGYAPEVDSLGFAVNLARNLGGNAYGLADMLFNVSDGADGNLFDANYEPLNVGVSVESNS